MSDTTKRDDGGPAFPLQSIGPDFPTGYAGMTRRDWLAGLAMQAIMSSVYANSGATFATIASDAYKMADAVIAEGKKP